MTAHWNVSPDAQTGRYVLPAVLLSGPGLSDLLHGIAEDLADSILDGDTRADAWADYIVRRSNLRAGIDDGADPETIAELRDLSYDAWDALAAELPNAIRLVLAEARLVAGQLDEAAGRVGIEGKRAA